MDHDFGFTGKPQLFETMVFDHREPAARSRWSERYMRRCATWEEAEEMHRKAAAWVKAGMPEEREDAVVD